MARMNLRFSNKHLQIDKANSLMLIATAITTVILVFSLVAANSLWKQLTYQNKVISLKSKANKQLEANINEAEKLKTAYDAFENSTESVIGTSDKNSKIVLDSLPSKYDFPALVTSLEGLITGVNAKISSITGTDNEAEAEQDSANPSPIEVPFELSADGNYTTMQSLVIAMERSIRPIKVTSLTLTGSDSNLTLDVSAITYYQPEKLLEVDQKTVPGPNSKRSSTSSDSKSANDTGAAQ